MVAARAGSKADVIATIKIISVAVLSASGSLLETPNSWRRTIIPSKSETGKAITTANPVSHKTSVMIKRKIEARFAPSAIRIPISEVLCAVE